MVGLSDLPTIAITFTLVAALFVAGFLVVDGLGDSTTDAAATSAVLNVTEGMSNIVEYAPIWYVPREIGLVRASPYWGEPEYHTWLPGKYGPYGVVALHWLGMQCAVVGIITGAAILSFGKPGNRETGGNRGGNRKPGTGN